MHRPRPLLLGHRGASKYAPENTAAAFDLALRHGCDGFELDVRYTRDSRCVICHNAFHRRRRISARLFPDLDLPSAEDVIRTYTNRAFLDIELKVPGEAGPILKALRDANPDKFVISSFLPTVLQVVRDADPSIPLGLICENLRQFRKWESLPVSMVIVEKKLATRALIDELHAAGKQVLVWTVNRKAQMLRFAELGVDGLISDDTRLLADTLSKH
ncbi:MAG TPA: glycerophosphodiester phosphodiesterase [Terriglobales bacterium]|nr:glycerophosphodiester phosphodiesterase [Terriglobales bacterium]